MTTGRIALVTALALAGCNDGKSSNPAPTATGPAAPNARPQPSIAQPAGALGPPPTVTWFKYSPPDGSYTLELPGKAVEKEEAGTKTVSAEFGTSGVDARITACGISVTTIVVASEPKTTLDNATSRPKEDATVLEEKDLALAGNPGRALTIENQSQRRWMRFYVVDKTLYALRCTGPAERATLDEAIVLKALGSFQLTAKK